MCRLLETITIKNGRALHLDLHNRRANEARRILFGATDEIDLGEHVLPARSAAVMPLVKCRVLFRDRVERVEYLPYRLPAVASLKLVRADDVDYRFKFEDRAALTALLSLKGGCDEILIVRRGLVTDTSVSNVVFSDGTRYVTPDDPLLAGVKRESLLREGKITAARITVDDIGRYRRLYLINCLIDLEDDVSVPVSAIRP
ncbi:MAG: aminotransferase class IV [Spirochaetales bacterium]|nr:aminotransferase class IV [Spirochaetales bacterium]